MYNNFFKNETKERAYWLGLITADGSIGKYGNSYRFNLGLQKKDKYILEQFVQTIGYTKDCVKQRKENFYNISIYNKELYDDLVNLGLMQNKTRKLDKNNIPNKYQWDFIRGVFDGDGSVGLYHKKNTQRKNVRFSIAGHKPFLEELSKIINNEINDSVRVVRYHQKSDVYSLYCKYMPSLDMIYHKLYDTSSLYMIRKKEKWDKIIAYIINNNYKTKTNRMYKIYSNGRSYIELNCKNCDKKINKRSDVLKKNKQSLFCSPKCFWENAKQNNLLARKDSNKGLQSYKKGHHTYYLKTCSKCNKEKWMREDSKSTYCSKRCEQI